MCTEVILDLKNTVVTYITCKYKFEDNLFLQKMI